MSAVISNASKISVPRVKRSPDRTKNGESERVYDAIQSLRRKGYRVSRSDKNFSLVAVRKMTTRDKLVAFAATAPDLS